MKNIITITLSPAVDKSTFVERIVPDHKLRCAEPTFEPGGGGINVSRALKKLGYASTAMYAQGGYTGKILQDLLFKENILQTPVQVQQTTRENFIVVETSTNLQYRYGMPSPDLTQGAIDYIVLSGSIPRSVSVDFFKKLSHHCISKNIKLVADTSGNALLEVIKQGVYLIKPNLKELSELAGVDIQNVHQQVEAAKRITKELPVHIIVVSLGAAGAMLVSGDELYHVGAPSVKRKSTVGAGDSMVAGMVYALAHEWPLELVLKYGIACGTAATMNSGTQLCNKEDVEMLFEWLKKH
jgi:6-phosphofructokinase 2